VVPEYQLFRVPDSVTLEHAPVSEPLACGAHATRLVERVIGPLHGMTVAVVGSGMIGMSCLIAAKIAGAAKVVMFGVRTSKAAVAKALGADEYVDVAAVDPVVFAQGWRPGGVDLAYECVGNAAAISSAVRVTRKAGAVMMMGVYEEEPRVPLNIFGEREQVRLSSQAYADEIGTVLEWMSRGLVDVGRLITARVPLRDIADGGFEEILRNRDKHIKVIVEID
jgi:(R,R)-butanediol dehydrogenase/meso-butanediol dehydrogenase/diacetyl reductase